MAKRAKARAAADDLTEADVMAAMRDLFPPNREAGWSTAEEVWEAHGKLGSIQAIRSRLNRAVEARRYEAIDRVTLEDGRIRKVYRRKP